MRVLLDTQMLIWAIEGNPRLSERARLIIEDEANEIYYSSLAIVEVAIKHMKHPDIMRYSPQSVVEYCAESGFYCLPVEERHAFYLETLSRQEGAPKHADPFDRMMIAQAKYETDLARDIALREEFVRSPMMLLTHDAQLAFYQEPVVLLV